MQRIWMALVCGLLVCSWTQAEESIWDLPPLPAASAPREKAPAPAARPAAPAPQLREIVSEYPSPVRNGGGTHASAATVGKGHSSVSAPVPGDTSAPQADASEEMPGTLGAIFRIFEKGGAVMWVLLLTSIVSATFVLERLLSLRRGVHLPSRLAGDVQKRMRGESVAAARFLLQGDTSALGRVLRAVLARTGASRAESERVVDEEVGRILWDLRRNIRPVGIASSVAPLIGLFGTVVGMILAFQMAAEKGMANPAHFAQGIYQALYTTAFGLMVSIPSLIAYQYLRVRAEKIMRDVEECALQFVLELDDGSTSQTQEPAPAVADDDGQEEDVLRECA